MHSAARSHETKLEQLGVRKRQGAYYTPEWMIERLLDRSLSQVLARHAVPWNMRIADPACGAGAFLTVAARRLLQQFPNEQRRIGKMLIGYDIDAGALEIARASLMALGIRAKLCAQDFLSEPVEAADLWVGNPPFRNVIERGEPSPTLQLFNQDLTGTADDAYQFVAKASRNLRPGGQIAMVLPRAFLAAPSAERLRLRLFPSSLECPEHARAFEGAAVFVVLAVLRQAAGTVELFTEQGKEFYELEAPCANWWELFGKEGCTEGVRLEDLFEVRASLTTGDAYRLISHIHEGATGPKLVTTGLIEPGECLWGKVKCRFLGSDYAAPRISVNDLEASLRQRFLLSKRPKVLVAGLSKRLEAYLDQDGVCMGSVSTYSIFHPEDKLASLQALERELNSESATRQLRHQLGANALGGGSITVTQRFLKGLRVKLAEPPQD